jgi:hypothetical protein
VDHPGGQSELNHGNTHPNRLYQRGSGEGNIPVICKKVTGTRRAELAKATSMRRFVKFGDGIH